MVIRLTQRTKTKKTMQLNENHRANLIEELKKAIALKESINFRLNNQKENNAYYIASCEVEGFLNDKRIEIIEKALTDNEIDKIVFRNKQKVLTNLKK